MAGARHLLILGDRDALLWVLREQRMAFPAHREREVSSLEVGDELLLCTTRGCFNNPTRDRGRVIGRATVTSPVAALQEPVQFADRQFPVGCKLRIHSLAPFGSGVELAPLVPRLSVFPNKQAWSALMRRTVLSLPQVDALLLHQLLERVEGEPSAAVETYAQRAPQAA